MQSKIHKTKTVVFILTLGVLIFSCDKKMI